MAFFVLGSARDAKAALIRAPTASSCSPWCCHTHTCPSVVRPFRCTTYSSPHTLLLLLCSDQDPPTSPVTMASNSLRGASHTTSQQPPGAAFRHVISMTAPCGSLSRGRCFQYLAPPMLTGATRHDMCDRGQIDGWMAASVVTGAVLASHMHACRGQGTSGSAVASRKCQYGSPATLGTHRIIY